MVNNPPQPDAILSSEHLEAARLLPIIIWPDKRLQTKCEDVKDFNDTLKAFVASMVLTMRHQDGVGLAAPQLGFFANVVTIDIPMQRDVSAGTDVEYEPAGYPFVLVNPKVVEVDDKHNFTWNEGCLSVPGYFEERTRPQRIVVEYQNDTGKNCSVEFQGLHAFAIQHELDHLEGKVFVDGLSRLKQDRIRKKITKTLNRRL